MFRKLWAIVLSALAAAITSIAFLGQPSMPLTLQIGATASALIQAGSVVDTLSASGGAASLATPSTAGTCLIAIVANGSGGGPPVISTFPTGWTLLLAQPQGTQVDLEIWAYLNNPGGISAVSFTSNGIQATWHAQLSEWSNVVAVSALETSGAATATSGTTLAPTTVGNVLTSGDVAISAWHQYTGVVGTVTFTTPGGWTRLGDDSAVSQGSHLDAEYLLNPPTGATLGPTLTSTGTTSSAAGIIIVLKHPGAQSDRTAFIKYGSLTTKQNTADFALLLGGHIQLEDGSGNIQLEDGSGSLLLDLLPPALGDPVAMTGPTWNGRVVSVTQADITEVQTNFQLVTVVATNSSAAGVTTPPGNLSDGLAPLAGGHVLLEDGSGGILLEDGSGYLLLENTLFSYSGLSVKKTQNVDGTVTTYGMVTVYETGYAPGQTIQITSSNLGLVAAPYLITNVTETFIGLAVPAYLIEFGDPYLSLQLAGAGVLTKQGSQASIQQGIQMGAGVLGYAQATTNQTGIGAAATDLASLTVTVTVGSGRRLRITGYTEVTQNTSAGLVVLRIKEGATQLGSGLFQLGAAVLGGPYAPAIIQPSAGVHTYKLTLETTAGTVDMNVGTASPAFILVEDIGT